LINVSDILDDIGLDYREVGKSFRVKCWHHDEGVPSMFINKESGVYHCFSCHSSGNIFQLITEHLGLTGFDLVKYLADFSINLTEEEIYNRLKNHIGSRKPKEVKQVRKLIRIPEYKTIENNDYLENRGITKEEIKQWEMGVVSGNQTHKEFLPYRNWIYIPIIQNGVFENYFLRSPFNNRKIYGKFPRKNLLFGLDSCTDYSKTIYVVEGIFDMIFLRKIRVQVVAALSNRLHKEQLELLKKYKRVVLVPDADSPGFELVKTALPLIYSTSLGVCSIPNGKKDTADCTIDELIEMTYNEKSILDFIFNERLDYGNARHQFF